MMNHKLIVLAWALIALGTIAGMAVGGWRFGTALRNVP